MTTRALVTSESLIGSVKGVPFVRCCAWTGIRQTGDGASDMVGRTYRARRKRSNVEHMPRDFRRLRTPALSVLLAVLATALPLTAASAAIAGLSATSAAPVPSPPSVGKAIEPFAGWEGNTICDPVDRPGVKKLAHLIRQTYGSDESIGTSRNACYTSSEHNDGRALDWMIDTSNKKDMAKARAFLDWLLATDKAGNKSAMARRLGVMYIIFNHRMWRAYSPRGWGAYSGTNPHTDHIHFSLSYDGSTGRTSFWKGQALADSCAPASLTTTAPKVSVDPMKYVPVAPTPVLSTATGMGTIGGRCRRSPSPTKQRER